MLEEEIQESGPRMMYLLSKISRLEQQLVHLEESSALKNTSSDELKQLPKLEQVSFKVAYVQPSRNFSAERSREQLTLELEKVKQLNSNLSAELKASQLEAVKLKQANQSLVQKLEEVKTQTSTILNPPVGKPLQSAPIKTQAPQIQTPVNPPKPDAKPISLPTGNSFASLFQSASRQQAEAAAKYKQEELQSDTRSEKGGQGFFDKAPLPG